MPRTARLVLPGFPHHVTQRGITRQNVFHTQRDRRVYLDLLSEYSRQAGIAILAYCLMPNHIHLVAVPAEDDSLAVCLRRTHGRYARYHNGRRVRSGHLWQNRFDSCAMEESHLWRAIRYVEMKPVRAGLVEAPERFRWSSAAAHCDGRDAFELLDMDLWQSSGGIARWGDLLQAATSESGTKRLRSAMYSSKPLGSEEFVRRARQAPKDKLEDGRAGGFSPTGSSFPGRATHMTSLSTQP